MKIKRLDTGCKTVKRLNSLKSETKFALFSYK